MASAAYNAWVAAGKPLTPSQPIRDYVTRLKLAFPRAAAANLFSWYANDAHYQAVPPQDHTPFSATGWPQSSPRWVVFATDIMHRPDLGVDCNVLFPYWLAEAKAGRTPWVKYIIWQAKLYDVRNGWRPVANSGHFDHIHKSIRTDHLNTSLGPWSIVPGSSSTRGDDMPKLVQCDDGPAGNGAVYGSSGTSRMGFGGPDPWGAAQAWAKFWGTPTTNLPKVAWAQIDAMLGPDIGTMVNGPDGGSGGLAPHVHSLDAPGANTGPAITD